MNYIKTVKHVAIVAMMALSPLGCATEAQREEERDFHTSGSREADQRAEQKVAQVQQLRGEGAEVTEKKKSLYDRLGGEAGLAKITDDWIVRAMADPRVNWTRKGITKGGVLGVGDKPVEWKPTPEAIAELKKHIARFLALASGGPVVYDGGDMKGSHAGMQITNAEFDAAIGDLKATLDANSIKVDEQKELLAIVESTRPQIVEER